MKKLKKQSRTFMPFDGGLSPITEKSVVPFNNVHTIQDVLNGDTYRVPSSGGTWGSDWNKKWGEDVEGSYKPEGDRYKSIEQQQSRDYWIRQKMLSGTSGQDEIWEVKVDGGVIRFPSFDDVQEYTKKVKPKYIRKLAQVENKIQKYISATYMVECLDVVSNIRETGSAFAISNSELITCAHVVKKYNKNNYKETSSDYLNSTISINVFAHGKKYKGLVKKIDWAKDLALIQVPFNMNTFFNIKFDVSVGSHIIAIGSPHGFENNASFGRVGSIGRDIYLHKDAPKYFTIDSPIFSGNSGGPVVNEKSGNVCGMVTAIVSESSNYGLNMAIDANYILNFIRGT